MALGARFAEPDPSGRLRVLVVGHAGGSVYRTLRDTLPEGMSLSVLGVEIDPAVVDVARAWLDHRALEGPDLELVTGEDARTVVNALPEDRVFDLVLVDAYTRTNYIPFQVASVEFFERLKRHLSPGGWIGVNVMGKGLGGPVAKSVATTMTKAVGGTYAVPNVFFPGNVILWASPTASTGPRIRVAGPVHPMMRAAEFSLERLAVRHDPSKDGGVLLTDDRSPSDRLADEELGL
jgi:spermidine synthase